MSIKNFLRSFLKRKKVQSVLRAKIIRADGTVEDLGIIARGEPIKNFPISKGGK